MPPRVRIRLPSQPLAYRPRKPVQWRYQKPTATQSRAYAAEDTHTPGSDLGKAPGKEGNAASQHNAINDSNQTAPNMDQMPHVSEESAAMDKSMGREATDVDQGTPVREAAEGDKELQSSLPKVMREDMRKGKPQPEANTTPDGAAGPSGKRSFSTSARQRAEDLQYRQDPAGSADAFEGEFAQLHQQLEARQQQQGIEEALSQEQLRAMLEEAARTGESLAAPVGLKFERPDVRGEKHLRKRYDTVVDQVTNLIMRHGMKAKAQKDVSIILSHLRTSPPPRVSPNRPIPLLDIHETTATALPLDPTLYLTVAIDSIAPLLRIRSQRGAAGGGMALQIPMPLNQRQRRRTAIQWIIEAVSRRGKTSGRASMSPFPKRFAEEVVAVIEGRSGIWDKRGGVHKLGVGARTNVNYAGGKMGRRGF